MKILKFDSYLDGGTIEVTTDEGIFCFDDRIRSTTRGKLYAGYPEDDNNNLVKEFHVIEKNILAELRNHENEFYKDRITQLIKNGKL